MQISCVGCVPAFGGNTNDHNKSCSQPGLHCQWVLSIKAQLCDHGPQSVVLCEPAGGPFLLTIPMSVIWPHHLVDHLHRKLMAFLKCPLETSGSACARSRMMPLLRPQTWDWEFSLIFFGHFPQKHFLFTFENPSLLCHLEFFISWCHLTSTNLNLLLHLL